MQNCLESKSQSEPKRTATEQESALSIPERKEMLVWKLMQGLCENYQEALSEVKKFRAICPYPGTKNEAMLCVEHDKGESEFIRLSTCVARHGTDRGMVHYMFTGTSVELSSYLSDRSNIPKLLDSWQHLSDTADEYS